MYPPEPTSLIAQTSGQSPQRIFNSEKIRKFLGSIDNRFGIHMTLENRDGSLQGTYSYDKVGTPITLRGAVVGSDGLVLDEINASGATTARFTGRFASNGILAGNWKEARSANALPFLLEVQSASGEPVGAGDRAIVVEERVLVQSRQHKESLPAGWDKDVLVRYPRISGLKNKLVLARARDASSLKRVLGSTIDEYKHDLIGWLYEVDYSINYNRDYILDMTFWQSGCGAYPDTQYGHVALNLKTGNEIRASDVFEPSSMGRLAALVNGRLHAYIRESIKEWAASGSDVAEDFPPNAKFRVKDLDKIRIEQRGVTFLWQFGFPHVIKPLEPSDGGFFFTYDELKDYIRKDGLLAVNLVHQHGF